MITLAWMIGWIVAYLAIGVGVAAWDMPRLHQRVKDSPEYCRKGWNTQAQVARGLAMATVMLWPARGPYLVVALLADKSNPDLIDRELRRREQAVIDRELAIKKLELQMQKELEVDQ